MRIFHLLMKSRRTDRGAKQFPGSFAVRAAPFALQIIAISFAFGCLAQSPSDIAGYLSQGDQAKSAKQFKDAIAAYTQARKLANASGDLKSEASALLRLATSEYFDGDYAGAEGHARESLAAHQKLGNKVGQASDWRLLGNTQYAHGDFPASEASHHQALALHEEIGDRKGIADDLNNLASTLREFDPLTAIEYFDRAQREFEALGNDLNRSTTLDNLGLAYQSIGDYARALEYGRMAVGLARKAADKRMEGIALDSLGNAETYRGNYREALALYNEALKCHRNFAWGRAQASTNIGVLYRMQGNHALAAGYFSRALELNASIGDRNLEADGHYNLALEYLAAGKLPDAKNQFGQGLELSRRYGYLSIAAACQTGIARIHALTGARTDAAAELAEAVGTLRGIPDRPRLALALTQLANLQLDGKQYAASLDSAREAEALSAAGELPEALWQAQLAAGKALRHLARDADASRELAGSISTIESLRSRVAGPPTAAPQYFGDKLEPYREMVTLALASGQTDKALEFAEQSKSRVLGDLLRQGRVDLDRALTGDERNAERRLEDRLAGLNLRVVKLPDEASRAARDRIRRDLEDLQTGLYAAHPEVAFERSAHRPMTAREMTDLATQTGAAILDYFATPNRLYVFLIKPKSRPTATAISVSLPALSRSAAEFRRELASHDLDYAAKAGELYSLLVAPLERALASEKTIMIIPDGPLGNISFQALQPGPGRFWIEDKIIAYAPSLEVLRETRRLAGLRRSSPAAGALLALGDPSGQPRLPEAARQVREIEKLYHGDSTLILTGEAASERRLREEAAKFRVVHLAAHAVLDDRNPMYSRALLARTPPDDGFLEARELMQYDLRAELLVLSACDTARGEAAAGEGINGMLWAAFVAGAPTTVASLWNRQATRTS